METKKIPVTFRVPKAIGEKLKKLIENGEYVDVADFLKKSIDRDYELLIKKKREFTGVNEIELQKNMEK